MYPGGNSSPLYRIWPHAYVFAFVRDITDRKRADDELKSAYEKNKGLMDYANDAIYMQMPKPACS